MIRPDAAELTALAGKYERLADLRRAHARGEPIPPRDTFREIAERFPGALRELDRLPLPTIEERAQALAHAAKDGSVEPWMAWLAGYHALFRAALYVKPRARRALEGGGVDDLVARARAHAPLAAPCIDAAFVAAVASPPAGRLGRVVVASLSAAFGVPEELVRRTLFPPRPERA